MVLTVTLVLGAELGCSSLQRKGIAHVKASFLAGKLDERRAMVLEPPLALGHEVRHLDYKIVNVLHLGHAEIQLCPSDICMKPIIWTGKGLAIPDVPKRAEEASP